MSAIKVVFITLQIIVLLCFIYVCRFKSIDSLSLKLSVSNSVMIEMKTFSGKDVHSKKCTPKKNIIFVKTHKTASTTVQNILIRKGIKLGAIFVLPRSENIICQKHRFRHTMVTQPTNFSYNMMIHHARFNYEEMKKIMPNDTLFITILRNPVSQFESMFSYYNLDQHYGVPFQNFTWDSNVKNLKKRFSGWLGSNQMLFDLGYHGHSRDGEGLDDYIKLLDRQFDLVMIAEKLEKSLLILRSLLCWTMEDMLSFRLNTRTTKKPIPNLVNRLVKSINFADDRLYNYFSNRLRQQIENYGESKMSQEAKELIHLNHDMEKKCHKKLNDLTTKDPVAGSPCWIMTRDELEFTRFMMKSQLQAYPFITPITIATQASSKESVYSLKWRWICWRKRNALKKEVIMVSIGIIKLSGYDIHGFIVLLISIVCCLDS